MGKSKKNGLKVFTTLIEGYKVGLSFIVMQGIQE